MQAGAMGPARQLHLTTKSKSLCTYVYMGSRKRGGKEIESGCMNKLHTPNQAIVTCT